MYWLSLSSCFPGVPVTIKQRRKNFHPVCVFRTFFPSGSSNRANRKGRIHILITLPARTFFHCTVGILEIFCLRTCFDEVLILCLSLWLQNTAHVSSACIGFCDSYSDEKKIVMAFSLQVFLKHQEQRWEDFSKSVRRDNYFVLVAMVAEYRGSCEQCLHWLLWLMLRWEIK